MYGSVSALDIVHLAQEQLSVTIEKAQVQLKHAIKKTGVHSIELKLPEGVVGQVALKITSEDASAEAVTAAPEATEAAE